MNVQHVCFEPCSATLRAQAVGGSLFNAILDAAAHFPPRIFSIDELSKLEAQQEEQGAAGLGGEEECFLWY